MKRIIKIDRIMELAKARKSVYVRCYGRKIPAAFLQNMQARLLYNYIRNNQLYEETK